MIKGVEALVAGFSEGAASGAEPAAFRELLDALPAAVYTTDAAGTITFVNRAAIELAGRTPTVGEDQWCVTFRLYSIDGKLLPHDECPMAIALKEARPVRDVEIMAERKISELPVVDVGGQPVGMLDITDIVSLFPQFDFAAKSTQPVTLPIPRPKNPGFSRQNRTSADERA